MLTVLYLMPWLIIGGAETQMVDLLRGLDRGRFRPLLCCIREEGPLFSEARAAGVQSYCLGVRPKYGPSAWRALRRLRALLLEEQVDILHAMEFNARILGPLAAIWAGVPVRVIADHSTGEWREPLHKRVLKRAALPLVQCVVAVAEAQRRYLAEERGVPPHKLRVIYNGVDPCRFPTEPRALTRSSLGLPEEAPVVGIIAAMRPEKDHRTFLLASQCLLDRIPAAHLVLVGDGAERPRLEAFARELGLEARAHFLGARRDIPDILPILDLVALSSRPVVETFPVSLLEAMAAGRPIVAPRVSGIPELVEEGRTGLLVPSGNPEALAAAMVHILSRRDRGRALGEEGRRRVERLFSLDRMVRQWEALYTDLWNRHAADGLGSSRRG